MDAASLDADLRSTNRDNVYRPSGRLGGALTAVPLAILVSVPILALVYAYVDVYCPIVGYVSFIFLGVYAFAVLLVVSYVGYKAKCRNATFLRTMGLLAGLFALYASWVAFVYALLGREGQMPLGIVELFLQPRAVWEVVQAINEDGWFSLRSLTPSGVMLWIMWGIEAAVIVGLPTLAASMTIDDELFCEPCNAWCPAWKQPFLFEMPSDHQRLEPLQSGKVDPLADLATVTAEEPHHLRLRVQRCEACQSTAAFQAEVVALTQDKEGKQVENAEKLTPLVLLQPIEFQKLEQFANLLASHSSALGPPPDDAGEPAAEAGADPAEG